MTAARHPRGAATTPGAPRRSTSGRRAGRRSRAAQPGVVGPPVAAVLHHAGGGRGDLGRSRHRVGLEADGPVGAGHPELVACPRCQAGDEELPDAAAAQGAHRVDTLVPAGEVAGHAHTAGVGRPNREGDPLHPLVANAARAEPPPQLEVAALADQVQVELAQRGQEAVGVVDGPRPTAVFEAQAVLVRAGAGERRLEQAAVVGRLAIATPSPTRLGPSSADGCRAGPWSRRTGMVPRMEWGSWWRPESRASVSALLTLPLRLIASPQGPKWYPGQVGPVAQLVADLVDRLLDLECPPAKCAPRRPRAAGRRRQPLPHKHPRRHRG